MMRLLTLHTIAAARGDGLRPELLAAIAEGHQMPAAGSDDVSPRTGIQGLEGLTGPGKSNHPPLHCVRRSKRPLSAQR